MSLGTNGISLGDLTKLRVWYPSMRGVKGHMTQSKNYRVIVVDLIGVKSHTNPTKIKYRILLDLSDFPRNHPQAFVLSPPSEDIEHVNIGHAQKNNLAPNKPMCVICLGAINSIFSSWDQDVLVRMRGFLNHLENILNTPNTGSRMRG
ncbi:MAG: hypothetical protein CME10_06005 [Gemmatimonadetes bacterium]|nr:hypothetical protein [Gemmatimonadota bacterium]MBR50118.1 hypothetical protein [Euryarchaeota archaeon]|tara:strand:+ start:3004 stop:3447 length:444 start_codon:yes stop_codon:yes gene_type:complete